MSESWTGPSIYFLISCFGYVGQVGFVCIPDLKRFGDWYGEERIQSILVGFQRTISSYYWLNDNVASRVESCFYLLSKQQVPTTVVIRLQNSFELSWLRDYSGIDTSFNPPSFFKSHYFGFAEIYGCKDSISNESSTSSNIMKVWISVYVKLLYELLKDSQKMGTFEELEKNCNIKKLGIHSICKKNYLRWYIRKLNW